MIHDDHSTAQYMNQFETALRRYGVPEWAEIANDLKSHISEAESYGKPLAEVIAALGPADTLARAYAVELLMGPPKDPRATAVMRILKILGLVVAGSFVSFCLAMTLGVGGVSLLLVGVTMIVESGLELFGIHQPYVNTFGLPPLTLLAIGLAALAIGWVACWLFWLYVRMAVRTLRKALPGGASVKPTA